MLRALLHRKLGGFGLDGTAYPEAVEPGPNDEDTGPDCSEPDVRALARDEDSLTATVFARLGYLPPDLAATLLSASTQVRVGEPPPRAAFGAGPEFWPRWRPHPDDRGRYVEPDVVLRSGADAIVVEVKWRGLHAAEQCSREVRAAAAKMPGVRLWLVMVGTPVRDRSRESALAGKIQRECSACAPLMGVATTAKSTGST